MNEVSFFVAGTPVPQGSLRVFTNPKTGFPRMVPSNQRTLLQWRDAIAAEARAHCSELMLGPVEVEAQFYLPRPASRPKKERYPDRMPDLDKLARACLDALTSVAFKDDSQVVVLHAEKHYAQGTEQPGARITVLSIAEETDGRSAPSETAQLPW